MAPLPGPSGGILLIEAFRALSVRQPAAVALRWLDDDGSEVAALSYGEVSLGLGGGQISSSELVPSDQPCPCISPWLPFEGNSPISLKPRRPAATRCGPVARLFLCMDDACDPLLSAAHPQPVCRPVRGSPCCHGLIPCTRTAAGVPGCGGGRVADKDALPEGRRPRYS